MPLFEENYHMYVPKSHPLAMTIHPAISIYKSITILSRTNDKLYKNKLIEKTKAQVRMISDMKLATYFE